MNLITQKTTWSTLEIGILKISVLSVGIIVGIYFKDFFEPFLRYFKMATAFMVITVIAIWLKKLRELSEQAL